LCCQLQSFDRAKAATPADQANKNGREAKTFIERVC
jgi:hypothetical protein